MKRILVILVFSLLGTSSYAEENMIANTDVANVINSMIKANVSAYAKLIASREKVHGCKTSSDYATDKTKIPTTEAFIRAVSANVKIMDEGKYAPYFEPSWIGNKTPGKMSLKIAADILHAYAASLRETYMKEVVAVAMSSKCSTPSEDWVEEKGIPLPAQFSRHFNEVVRRDGMLFCSLESEWPLNRENAPQSTSEKNSIQTVQNRKPTYLTERLAGKDYFTAVYPDLAVSDKCVSCHNKHPDSPKRDFKLGDVMGAMILRIPLKN